MNKELISDVQSESSSTKSPWMTTREVAEYLRSTPGQIRNYAWQGKLTRYHLGNRDRFLRSDVEKFIQLKVPEKV
ncbi:helix-turn-helix domain-containing protein [Bdellovibrionota bacterium FG-2]